MIQLCDKNKCCGCSSCKQACPKQCITMVHDVDGILYPRIDTTKCINCKVCVKACSVLNKKESRFPYYTIAAFNKNNNIRKESSSGGIFTLVAEKIINEGGVVFGARFNNNWDVIHDYTDNIENLQWFRGSKYVQSCIGNCYSIAKTFLDKNKKVLFTGTPCQISGLRQYLGKEYDNLICMDVICHGVPNQLVWQDYLREHKQILGNKYISYRDISFRNKDNGWKGFNIRMLYVQNGYNVSDKVYSHSEPFYNNTYMTAFLNNLSLIPSCFSCHAKCGKSGSDITIGDFWGVDEILQEFDDDKGCSIVLCYTEKGNKMIESLKMQCKEVLYSEILKHNMCIEQSVERPLYWGLFYKLWIILGFHKALKIIRTRNLVIRIVRRTYILLAYKNGI